MNMVCKQCGKEFHMRPSVVKRGGGKFCSQECVNKYYEEQKTYTNCKVCGKEFSVKPSILARGGGKYCSLECRNAGYKKYRECEICGKQFYSANVRKKTCSKECANKLRIITTGNKPREIVSCKQCGKEFLQKNKTQKYCSRDCYHLASRTLPTLNCMECGKEFRPYSKNDTAKFCSKKCARKYIGETSIETFMREGLEKANILFEQEVKIEGYSIDFKVGKLLIECDGIYWHKDNLYDRKKDRVLQRKGYTVYRFTDKEIIEDLDSCIQEIREFSPCNV